MATAGETLNLEVMSPVTVAYLLEAISDINKTSDINKLRHQSGPKPSGKSQQGKSMLSESTSSTSEEEEESSPSSASSGSHSNVTLPPVSTVFSGDLLALSTSTAQIMPIPSPTLVDVTNSQQHRHHQHVVYQQQQLYHQQQHDDSSEQMTTGKTQQPIASRRHSLSRKRSIEVDDVSDEDDGDDDNVTSRRTKKRTRSNSSDGKYLPKSKTILTGGRVRVEDGIE